MEEKLKKPYDPKTTEDRIYDFGKKAVFLTLMFV